MPTTEPVQSAVPYTVYHLLKEDVLVIYIAGFALGLSIARIYFEVLCSG